MSHDTETHRFALPGTAAKRAVILVIVLLACLRLAHIHLLWADEDYHIAASINLLHGKVPYRDFWYDKPPLSAFYYLLIGGRYGWALRLLDSAYVLVGCGFAYGLARQRWGEAEGIAAAVLLAFFLALYHPSAVVAFAADALMLVPHLAAVYFAQRRLAIWAGVFSGIAFLANTKGVFVLATCGLWLLPQLIALAFGFAVPVAIASGIGVALGAWSPYIEQVWRWGVRYMKGSRVGNAWVLGFQHTSNWIGFHALLVACSPFTFAKGSRSDRWQLGAWIVLSFGGVALGSRFAPHYFLQLLPALVITGARGLVIAWRRYRIRAAIAFGALAIVPVIRFGPHYVELTLDAIANREPRWTDVALDLDSQKAAARLRALAHRGDTLLVWGYRPDIYVYTRLVSDSRFWDSQPLTGVAADRHLTASATIYAGPAAANRLELARSKPTFLVDGLGLMNPRLAPDKYPELKRWFADYKLVGRTGLSLIYVRSH